MLLNIINLKNPTYQRITTYLTARKLPLRQPEEENVPSISLKGKLKIPKSQNEKSIVHFFKSKYLI